MTGYHKVREPVNRVRSQTRATGAPDRVLKPLNHEALEPDKTLEVTDVLEAFFIGASPGSIAAVPGSRAAVRFGKIIIVLFYLCKT